MLNLVDTDHCISAAPDIALQMLQCYKILSHQGSCYIVGLAMSPFFFNSHTHTITVM